MASALQRTETIPDWPTVILSALGISMLKAQGSNPRPQNQVGLALLAGRTDPASLQLAACDTLAMRYACKVTQAQILAATHELLVIGFEARTLPRPRRSAVARDPVALIWPFGYRPKRPTSGGMVDDRPERTVAWCLGYLERGIGEMLSGEWAEAVGHLQEAATGGQYLADPQEAFLFGRAVAANINLAIGEATGGA